MNKNRSTNKIIESSSKVKRTEKICAYISGILFLFLLCAGFMANLYYKAPEVSLSERRVLKSFPDFLVETGAGRRKRNEKFAVEFEEYALDNFVGRDFFRRIKAYAAYDFFRQKDNHGIYVSNGNAYKLLKINERSIAQSAEKIKKMRNLLPDHLNVYYSVIPDKGAYVNTNQGYPRVDYETIERILADKMPDFQYIDLREVLKAESFYITDIHWKQEKLGDVLRQLSKAMNFEEISMGDVNKQVFDNFYGVYYGQSALPLSSEKLICLQTSGLSNSKVSYFNTKTMQMEEGEMYDELLFDGTDPYDVYLRGPQPLIIIENPDAATEKELFLFRDSFSSSLAPLLTGSYKKITLIDLRYLAGPVVEELVNVKENSDVLFLYSVQILNDSSLFLIN